MAFVIKCILPQPQTHLRENGLRLHLSDTLLLLVNVFLIVTQRAEHLPFWKCGRVCGTPELIRCVRIEWHWKTVEKGFLRHLCSDTFPGSIKEVPLRVTWGPHLDVCKMHKGHRIPRLWLLHLEEGPMIGRCSATSPFHSKAFMLLPFWTMVWGIFWASIIWVQGLKQVPNITVTRSKSISLKTKVPERVMLPSKNHFCSIQEPQPQMRRVCAKNLFKV